VTTAAQLQQQVALINALPVAPGALYEIIVGASLTLTQSLVVNRPINLRGSTSGIVISGSQTVVNGLTLNSGAGGSRISNLVFSGFSGTAVALSNAQNVAISTIAANNSGTGLAIRGASAGTTVRGCAFTGNKIGISLVGASGVTVGGTAPGQANTITAAARAGVFASGACANTQVIKTAITRTPTPYSLANARFLKIVR
jgi:nitrous oxidase accessory protein NosD